MRLLYGCIRYLINLTERGMFSSTVTKELPISLLLSFKILNFGQIKLIFYV